MNEWMDGWMRLDDLNAKLKFERLRFSSNTDANAVGRVDEYYEYYILT